MTPTVITYLIYVVLSLGLTVWVARTLSRNGRPFLIDALKGNETLADSVNHLLVVGFYLVNLGYASLSLKLGYSVANTQEMIEALSMKVGLVVVVLGAMHFLNLYVFARIRRAETEAKRRAVPHILTETAPPPLKGQPVADHRR